MPETIAPKIEPFEAGANQPEPPEIILDKAVLYHGSADVGIRKFLPAENTTVGHGVYLTDNSDHALGYAQRSTYLNKHGQPVVYQTEVNHARIVNLDNPEKLAEIVSQFRPRLQEIMAKTDKWSVEEATRREIAAIDGGVRPGTVRKAVFHSQDAFTTMLIELGYDGLKTGEGGEHSFVGNHSSYVIFDPEQVRVVQELQHAA